MVVVKARLGGELRRIPLHNEDLTYSDLVLMLQRVFGLNASDDISLKYTDEGMACHHVYQQWRGQKVQERNIACP